MLRDLIIRNVGKLQQRSTWFYIIKHQESKDLSLAFLENIWVFEGLVRGSNMTTPAASGSHLGQSLHKPALSHNITLGIKKAAWFLFYFFNYWWLDWGLPPPIGAHWSSHPQPVLLKVSNKGSRSIYYIITFEDLGNPPPCVFLCIGSHKLRQNMFFLDWI